MCFSPLFRTPRGAGAGGDPLTATRSLFPARGFEKSTVILNHDRIVEGREDLDEALPHTTA